MALVTTGLGATQQGASASYFVPDGAAGTIICKSPDKLQGLLSALPSHDTLHYVSDGDWSTHDLVLELVRRHRPCELFITTYALRELPVRQLIMAQERGDILSVTMLLDYRAKARTPEVFQLASLNVRRIFLTAIHAKVTVLRSPDATVAIVGSANWTQNPRIEAGVITRNPSVAAFHIDWIEKVSEHAEIFS